MTTDGPVLTKYPHDRLSRLADIMTDALDRVPGTDDVHAVVILGDRNGGCFHHHNYPDRDGVPGRLFVDVAANLMQMGKALGVRVDVLINGRKAAGTS
jgi:hypothetical protein